MEAEQVNKKEEGEEYLLTLSSMRRRLASVEVGGAAGRAGAQTQTSKERLLSFCRACVWVCGGDWGSGGSILTV